jgi:hypothetical protein
VGEHGAPRRETSSELSNLDLSSLESFAASHGPRCSIGRLIATLSDKDAAAVKEALASDHGHTTIARWLMAAGHKVNDHTIAHHRRKNCSCD